MRDHLDVAWWIRAADESTIMSDLAELAQVVGCARGDDLRDAATLALRRLDESE